MVRIGLSRSSRGTGGVFDLVMHNYWAYFSMAESRLLGGHMAAARRAAGVSAVSLARRLRIPEATLGAYEAGRARLPVPLLFAAARALRVAPYQLLAGRPDRVLNPWGPTLGEWRSVHRRTGPPASCPEGEEAPRAHAFPDEPEPGGEILGEG